ncbi:MAG: T9SS type A sorting domain-containing protein [Bacteroidales bacterium]|jgi:aminopeptidase N|nr:T9SS type A sorting domain-containing protein [Bacteroidales bacterium]
MKENLLFFKSFGIALVCLLYSASAFSQIQNFPKIKKTPGSENFDIVYQRCEWNIDPNEAEMSGKIVYYFEVLSDSFSEIFFNFSDNMNVDSIMKNDEKISYRHSDNLIRIEWTEDLHQNDLDSLTIIYHGIPRGSGLGSYERTTHSGVPVVWTLSAPYGAEDWFPCKNDLRDKTDSLDIFITTPANNLAAANGKLVSITPIDNGKLLHHWKHRYPIVTYLICFAVTNYEAYSDWYYRTPDDSLEVLNYIYPESLENVKTKTPSVLKAMAIYERLFGTYPYPDEKYGHAQFGWSGGMEHQTMSFMGSWTADILAHELSHQWFGNMITCGSWHDIWINEGFATYCTALFLEETNPNQWSSWKSQTINNVTSRINGSVYCDDTTDVYRIYDSRLTYNKGALVLHMLRWVLGDDSFFKGIWNFANDPELQYGFACTDDVKRHFEAVSNTDLTDFFDTWVYNQGYPTYTVTLSQDEENELLLLMEQIPSHESVQCFKLPIPIKFIGEDRDTTIIFYNDQLSQTFRANTGFKVAGAVFDPERWLLARKTIEWVGIDDLDMENEWINLFPNPADDHILIRLNHQSKAHWAIYNMSGKKMASGDLNKNHTDCHINTSNLDTGVYIFNVQFAKKKIAKKFTISR